jgi:hypothetical protein
MRARPGILMRAHLRESVLCLSARRLIIFAHRVFFFCVFVLLWSVFSAFTNYCAFGRRRAFVVGRLWFRRPFVSPMDSSRGPLERNGPPQSPSPFTQANVLKIHHLDWAPQNLATAASLSKLLLCALFRLFFFHSASILIANCE